MASNVVQLRPAVRADARATGGRPPLRALNDLNDLTQADGPQHGMWEASERQRKVAPTSVAEARERRRTVLLSLTGFAVVTLLVALMAPSTLFISLHVVADLALVGFAILLVRHRQMSAQRSAKVEPIRPAVTAQPPAPVQLAPSYLVSNG